MAMLELGPGEGLYYEYHPAPDREHCFVFVNALTGNTGMWQAAIGPALRDAGFGTLAYNFRGQADSPFRPTTALTDHLLADDLHRLLANLRPSRPILVGLSIGGLFAARAWLQAGGAEAMVFINTLRKPSPRLEWIGQAMIHAVRTGGPRLLMDMYLPLLVNQDHLRAIRGQSLLDEPYEPLDTGHGHYRLMVHGADADWDLPYEELTLPVLNITGLQDRLFYEAADVAELAGRLPQPTMIEMADTGHLIPVERPAALTRTLIDFARSL